jgi:hypothetical protein
MSTPRLRCIQETSKYGRRLKGDMFRFSLVKMTIKSLTITGTGADLKLQGPTVFLRV